MNEDKLVEIILKKVMEELQKIDPKDNIESKNNTKVVNYLGDDVLLKDELSKIVKIQDGLNLKNKYSDISNESNSKKIVISTLCIDGLISIAQGKNNFVIDTLLNGGRVYVIEEGIVYKKYTSPKNLIKVYDEYLSKLESYGIEIVKRNDISSILEEKEKIFIDGIITENKLKKLNIKNKTIVLNSNNKITSLAQDYMKQNNIEVYYERGL